MQLSEALRYSECHGHGPKKSVTFNISCAHFPYLTMLVMEDCESVCVDSLFALIGGG